MKFDQYGIRIADEGETPLSHSEILHALEIGEAYDEQDEIDKWPQKVIVRKTWEPINLTPHQITQFLFSTVQQPANSTGHGGQHGTKS
jgi:hypothetical protein